MTVPVLCPGAGLVAGHGDDGDTDSFHLTFCGSNKIYHFACHVLALLKLACGKETASVTIGVIMVCVTALMGCLFFIVLSMSSSWLPSEDPLH